MINISMKKLEEVMNIMPADDDLTPDEAWEESKEIIEAVEEDKTVMLSAISNSEKINAALPAVLDIEIHDGEMNDIAAKALDMFDRLDALGMQVTDAHAGKIFEVASTMLKTALDARDAKVNRKLKQVELMIKKQKLDHDTGDVQSEAGEDFDRNELIKMFMDVQKEQQSDK